MVHAPEGEEADKSVLAGQTYTRVEKILGGLSEAYDKTHKVIAEELKRHLRTVKIRICPALRRLREALEKDET